MTNNRRVNKGKKVAIEEGRKLLGLKGNGKGRPLVKNEGDDEIQQPLPEIPEVPEAQLQEQSFESNFSEDGIYSDDDADEDEEYPADDQYLENFQPPLATPTLRDRTTLKKPTYVAPEEDTLESVEKDQEYQGLTANHQKSSYVDLLASVKEDNERQPNKAKNKKPSYATQNLNVIASIEDNNDRGTKKRKHQKSSYVTQGEDVLASVEEDKDQGIKKRKRQIPSRATQSEDVLKSVKKDLKYPAPKLYYKKPHYAPQGVDLLGSVDDDHEYLGQFYKPQQLSQKAPEYQINDMGYVKTEPEANFAISQTVENYPDLISPSKLPLSYQNFDPFAFDENVNNAMDPYGQNGYYGGYSNLSPTNFQSLDVPEYPTMFPHTEQQQFPGPIDTTALGNPYNESALETSSNPDPYNSSDPVTDETDVPLEFMNTAWLQNQLVQDIHQMQNGTSNSS